MTLPGECVNADRVECCGETLKIEVLMSTAGYYIGFFCPKCGHYNRESGYYKTKEMADKALETNGFYRL